jgi:sulfopyruvate decarboxylase TPP-binding subunit
VDPVTFEIEWREREVRDLRARLEAGKRTGRIYELAEVAQAIGGHEERLRVLMAAVAEAKNEGEKHGHR